MYNKILFAGIEIYIYRDDLNHPTVSGNKLHKLTPNLNLAKLRDCSSILSFGGPYSNHLHALAWACKASGLESIGVVRGELSSTLTPTLADCEKWGMRLLALSRKEYRQCQEKLSNLEEPCRANDIDLGLDISNIEKPQSILIVPEGGSNQIAIDSLTNAYKRTFSELNNEAITHAVCATGTGATMAGLYQAAPEDCQLIAMQAVAEGEATLERIRGWLGGNALRLQVEASHLGRFAKMTPELLAFIEWFEAEYDIPLDPVYTGKAMFKLKQMIDVGYFKKSDKILFVHTGGLQGRRSMTMKGAKI